MALTLTPAERAGFLAEAHTAVLTTLRADGRPVSLPVWFVERGGDLFLRTPPTTAKLRRIRRDPRGSLLVERGRRWVELAALHLDVEISEVDDPTLTAEVNAALDAKYESSRVPTERLPAAVQRTYGDRVVLRLRPTGEELSWDNAKIRLR